MNENIYDNGGFHWWFGVVEDRMDPLFLGRCRVRITGYHTKNKSELPTKDLPWALPIQPITSAATTGVGSSPVGPVHGTWVVGFFADADDGQQPVMMGTIAGIPQQDYLDYLGDDGFQDPEKQYPRRALLHEADTNRLARNHKLAETIVGKKRSSREKSVQTALGSKKWEQPTIPYSAKYPFNHVTEGESGHTIEIDNTPSSERLHVYHKAGSFVEIDANGTMVRKIVGSDYQIIEKNGYILVKGKANVTVEGDCNLYVKNNCNVEVDGNLKTYAHGNIEIKSGKKLSMTAVDGIDIYTKKNMNIKVGGTLKIISSKTMELYSKIKTKIASLVTQLGPIKINSFTISPFPVRPPSIKPPSLTSTKSPKATSISEPGLTLSAEERLEFIVERNEAAAIDSDTAKEYAALKTEEIDTNERVAATTEEEVEPNADCKAGLKIVELAQKDVGLLEYGAVPGGDPKDYGPGTNFTGRIDQMMSNTGLDNKTEAKRTGRGHFWCAGAVTTWWKEAGLKTPPNSFRCSSWEAWGKSKGIYSSEPQIGAAALYGTPAYHIGIVAQINDDGTIVTIEGNTSGGGFSRNGVGCFKKRPKLGALSGYVHIPTENCDAIPAAATDESGCVSAKLKAFIAKVDVPENVRAQLPDVACKFAINTPLRMSHFLAQCKHESVGFREVNESLNYGWKGLRKTFSKYFPTEQLAKQYERNESAIGNKVYANRIGNGNEASGDGYKYRGRGYIQLTGKANYTAFNAFVPENVVTSPDLVASKYPLVSAAWFWSTKNVNSRADGGRAPTNVVAVTKVVNGGTNGLAERQKNFDEYIALA